MISRAAIGAILCATAACSRGPAPTPAGQTAPAPAAAPAAPAATTPASDGAPSGAAPGGSIPVTGAFATASGQDAPLARDGSAVVDPAAAFRVEVAAHLVDGRLALLDENDAMVASSGTTEVASSWTRYRLSPEEPLRPGTSYHLRLDGAVEREAHDPTGHAYQPVVLKLTTSGTRPPPAAKAKRSRGKRHR